MTKAAIVAQHSIPGASRDQQGRCTPSDALRSGRWGV